MMKVILYKINELALTTSTSITTRERLFFKQLRPSLPKTARRLSLRRSLPWSTSILPKWSRVWEHIRRDYSTKLLL